MVRRDKHKIIKPQYDETDQVPAICFVAQRFAQTSASKRKYDGHMTDSESLLCTPAGLAVDLKKFFYSTLLPGSIMAESALADIPPLLPPNRGGSLGMESKSQQVVRNHCHDD